MTSATSKFSSTPTYSFKGKREDFEKKYVTPSPLAYNPELLKDQVSIKFTRSKRITDFIPNLSTPGPGAYESTQASPMFIQKSRKKITHSNHLDSKNAVIPPGPGAYSPDIKFKSPSFSMRQRFPSMPIKNETPAPGSYEIHEPSALTPRIVFPKSPRRSEKVTDNPGPGTYESNSSPVKYSSEKPPRMSKSERSINFSISSDTPGPGKYDTEPNIKKDSVARSFSIGKSNRWLKSSNSIIGPGAYISTVSTLNSKGGLIGKNRLPLFNNSENYSTISPGPGLYNPYPSILETKTTAFKFNKEALERIKIAKKIDGVSPWSYEPSKLKFSKNHPNTLIGVSKRNTFSAPKLTPGPSDYSPLPYKSPSSFIKIPKAERVLCFSENKKIPGPGAYEVAVSKSTRSIKFSPSPRKFIMEETIKHNPTLNVPVRTLREEFPNPPKYMGVKNKISNL